MGRGRVWVRWVSESRDLSAPASPQDRKQTTAQHRGGCPGFSPRRQLACASERARAITRTWPPARPSGAPRRGGPSCCTAPVLTWGEYPRTRTHGQEIQTGRRTIHSSPPGVISELSETISVLFFRGSFRDVLLHRRACCSASNASIFPGMAAGASGTLRMQNLTCCAGRMIGGGSEEAGRVRVIIRRKAAHTQQQNSDTNTT